APLGGASIAAGYAIGMVVGCISGVVALWDVLGRKLVGETVYFMLRVSVISALALAPVLALEEPLRLSTSSSSLIESVWKVGSIATVYGVAFLTICAIRKEPQMALLWHTGRRMRRWLQPRSG